MLNEIPLLIQMYGHHRIRDMEIDGRNKFLKQLILILINTRYILLQYSWRSVQWMLKKIYIGISKGKQLFP